MLSKVKSQSSSTCQARKLNFPRSPFVPQIYMLCSLCYADSNEYHHTILVESEFFTIFGFVVVASGVTSKRDKKWPQARQKVTRGEKKSDPIFGQIHNVMFSVICLYDWKPSYHAYRFTCFQFSVLGSSSLGLALKTYFWISFSEIAWQWGW